MGQHEIYNFLKANEGIWFNTKSISSLMQIHENQFRKCINKMLGYPDLFIGLEWKEQKEYRKGELSGYFVIKYYRVYL